MSTPGNTLSALLPQLPGVRPLTKNEIKKDIHLIESYYDSDDSDGSVSSSEAVSSTYPVKPRNFAKLPKKDELLLQSKIVPHSHIDIGAGMSMNDAVEFMKAVEMARSDVYEGEKERENLEIRYQAMREMSISQSEAFLAKKKEQKNFIRAMQGLCRNRVQYFDALSQKNSMLFDMITSLQHKKDELNFFGKSLAELVEQGGESKQETVDQEKGAFHFYKNQCVDTPVGTGSIVNINAAEEKVTIKLPFGIMYSTFAAVVSWRAVTPTTTQTLDVNHVDSLRQKWTRDLATSSTCVGMSEKLGAEVEQLLKSDKQPPPIVVQEAIDIVEGKQTRKSSSKSRRSCNRTKDVASTEHVVSHETEEESSATASSSSSVGGVPDIDISKKKVLLDHTKKLPLLFCPPGIAPYLASTYGGNYITEKANAKAKEANAKAKANNCPEGSTDSLRGDVTGHKYLETEYCVKAFQRKSPVKFFCHMGNDENYDDDNEDDISVQNDDEASVIEERRLDCRFDDYAKHVVDLKENLHPLLEKIKDCRKRKRVLAHQVEHAKMNTARISQQISKIRLSMFTRRVLFHQNQIAMAVQEKSEKENGEGNAAAETKALSDTASQSLDKNKISNGQSPEKNDDHGVDDTQANSRRKSTRTTAVVATSAISDLQSSSRTKRKKDDVSKDEEVSVESSSTSSTVPGTASAANGTKSASSSLKRNPKRSRR